MLYTSYFAMQHRLPNNIVPISIALKTPDFWSGATYKKLAPLWSTISKYKDNGDWEAYEEDYIRTVLSLLSPFEVYNELMEISGGKDACMDCYENKFKNCHRHIVSKWFRDAGYDCKEYDYG